MRILVAVFVLLWLLSPASSSAQCTAPGCDLATAVILQARATGRAVLTAEAPPTSTPAPTSTPQPTATATSTPAPTATPLPTATATNTPAPTATPQPTHTATATSAPQTERRSDNAPLPVVLIGALAFLTLAILFFWIAVKAVINARLNK